MPEKANTPRIALQPIPLRMRDLPLDDRGYPVPWFVAWVHGKPEFRALDPSKFARALREKLCWVCGGKLGANLCFVAGPMCGINRTSSEPPSHLDCGRWSARNCPFLSNPRQVRREDKFLNNASLRENAPGIAITRNPGVAMLWITRQYEVFKDGNGGLLIQMGEPDSVEWFCCGRPATHMEVIESIDAGLPNLEVLARQEDGGLAALERHKHRFTRWIPPAPARSVGNPGPTEHPATPVSQEEDHA